MVNKYKLVTCSTNLGENTSLQSFGIAYVEEGVIVYSISDISTEKATVVRMLDKFNERDLDVKFFREEVEKSLR